MKKKAKERIQKTGRSVKKAFNAADWMGYRHIESSAKFLKQAVDEIFVPPPPGGTEDFSNAVESLGLTNDELVKKRRSLFRLSVIFVCLGFLVFCYALFHLLELHYRAFFPSLVLSGVCWAFAFRYHFWYFQIRVQRLGCTFHDWLNYIFPGKKS